jgi:hypothetical protein
MAGCLMLVACHSGPDLRAKSSSEVTFHRDVRPITEAVCARCHADTSLAPFTLNTYADVSSMAELVLDSVESGAMPPFYAADGCDDYEDDFSLTEAEIQVFRDWVAAGVPEGDSRDAPVKASMVSNELTHVDYVLQLPEAYTPADQEDDYRCFVLDWPDPSVIQTVAGFNVLPDDTASVHHLIAYIVPPDLASEFDALSGADGRPGYSCFGGPGGPVDHTDPATALRWIAAWAPGTGGGMFPEGTGIPIEGGSRVVLQIHYHPEVGNPLPDQSSVEIAMGEPFADEWAIIQPFTNVEWLNTDWMEIPAQSEGVKHSYRMEMDQDFTVYSAGIHMHLQGRTANLTHETADGESDCLLDVQNYDFNWQRQYWFSEKKQVQIGDTIALECSWDNPSDENLYWGEGTNDEMCLGTLYVTE